MNWEVFITCAITGSGDTAGKSPHVPVTPEQIANECIAAAKAGAHITHIHVRDPETGAATLEIKYFREAVDRIRASGVQRQSRAKPGSFFGPSVAD